MKNEKQLHLDYSYSDPNWQPPQVIYGDNLMAEATNTDEKYAVITMEIPWNLVKHNVTKQPDKVIFIPNMYLETLEKIEKEIPGDIEMVIGIGGGSSHDGAKYIALKRNIRLLQMPTMFGGDAVVCSAIGIREDKRVKYIAHTRADKIYVDFTLIRKAPEKLIRYGAADVLSSYTALQDWKLASDRGKETYNRQAAEFAENVLLKRLSNQSYEIRTLTDQGIKTIVELFIEYAKLANINGTDRGQEGSEHFFCYNAEYLTGRTYVHGSLLSLGIWTIGSFYYDKAKETRDFLDSLGLEYSLSSAGLSNMEYSQTLRSLDHFTTTGGYYYSVVNERHVDHTFVKNIMDNMS